MRIAALAVFYAVLLFHVGAMEAQNASANAPLPAAMTQSYLDKCKVRERLASGKPKDLKKASRCLTAAAANLNSLAVSEARITRLNEMLERQQARLLAGGAAPAPVAPAPAPLSMPVPVPPAPPTPPPPPPPAKSFSPKRAPAAVGMEPLGETTSPVGSQEGPVAVAPADNAAQPAAPINSMGGGGKTGAVEGLQDAKSSPSACPDPSILAQPEIAAARVQGNSHLRVTRSVMEQSEVKDDFGYRIGSRYSTFQVTVANLDPDHLYMIHDISLDYSDALAAPAGTFQYRASTRDLSLMRGVPEQGADLDPRNLTLHFLQGIGSVAGAISGLTPFAGVMGSSVAAFNGPFVQGFMGVLPDHSATQLNRLSDSAFQTNMVVDKGRSRSIAVFVPMQMMKDVIDMEEVNVCVDGVFVTEVTPPATAMPTLTSAVFKRLTAGTPLKAGDSATLTVTGTGLVDKDTQVLLNGQLLGTLTTKDGKAGTLTKALLPGYTAGWTVGLEATGSNTPSAFVPSTEQ